MAAGASRVGTTCQLRYSHWEGPLPEEGDFIRTDAGSCYMINAVRGKQLYVTRLGKDAVQFGDPGVHYWRWNSR